MSEKDAHLVNKVLEKISDKAALWDAKKILNVVPGIRAITDKPEIVEAARQLRVFYNDMIRQMNGVRALYNRPLIPYRKFYSPNELEEQTLWSEVAGRIKGTADDLIGINKNIPLPDYVKPNAPFNARALARKHGIPNAKRKMHAFELAERYSQMAGRDMFNTAIIANNKHYAEQLQTMGLDNVALAIQDWTAQAFAGVRHGIDKMLMPPSTRKLAKEYRKARAIRTFGFNLPLEPFYTNGFLCIYSWSLR